MKKKNIRKTNQELRTDLINELLEKEDVDEMGLLDLVFIEEILNQKSNNIAG
jgi:hypothetical protein